MPVSDVGMSMRHVMMGRRGLLVRGLGLGLAISLPVATPAAAQGAAPAPPLPVAVPVGASPEAVVASFTTGLERMMRAGTTTPFKARFDLLAQAVDRTFDLATILAVSVGARWAGMDAAVKADLSMVFRTYTIASYVANFGGHDGETFQVEPDTRASGDDRIVRTRIVPRTGDGVKLDYVMRQSDTGWRAVDVLADGTISRVAVQRSDFRGLLGRDGNTAALLDSLRRKITDLSGGAL
jgi:phospholipid transport system substrate-binding protein